MWMKTLLIVGGMVVVVQTASAQQVVDLPTRPGVIQRFLDEEPKEGRPIAQVILLPGGSGGIALTNSGGMNRWGTDNFVVRTRGLLHKRGMATVVLDAPSDRPPPRSLDGFRQTAGHVEDLKTVIASLRSRHGAPVWVIGFSAGTLSAAYLATQLSPAEGGPDGVVLTGAIVDNAGLPSLRPVNAMNLQRISVPFLVVHHEVDGCKLCPPDKAATLADLATSSPRRGTLMFSGGLTRGDPCHAWAHHGFNGVEEEVIRRIADWVLVGR